MNITINVLGIELARISFDLGDLLSDSPSTVSKLDRGVKGVSNWWVKRMNR